jgi:hypothetical protein
MVVIAVLVVGAIALAWPIAAGISGSSRSAERDRRLRYVARHPQQVNTGDIARILTRELGRDDCDLLLDKAQELGIKPWTMYSWIQQFDVHTLTVVIAAELPHEDLLRHLADGALPDLNELEVFAAINGLPVAEPKPARGAVPRAALAGPARTARPVARPAAQAVAESAAPATAKLPPIFEPGSWPYDQFGAELPEWPEAPGGPLAA